MSRKAPPCRTPQHPVVDPMNRSDLASFIPLIANASTCNPAKSRLFPKTDFNYPAKETNPPRLIPDSSSLVLPNPPDPGLSDPLSDNDHMELKPIQAYKLLTSNHLLYFSMARAE